MILTVGFKNFSTTNDSAIIDSVGVSEIGLRSLLILHTAVVLGSVEVLASFKI